MQTVLFFLIHEAGMTEGLHGYIKAVQSRDPRATAQAWLELTKEERAIIQAAYEQTQKGVVLA